MLGDLLYRSDSATFPVEVAACGGNPGTLPSALLMYVRVHCTAASTIPGSGVQASFTWLDDAGTPQQHDTIISLDTLGTSSIPETFLTLLGIGEPLNIQATVAGDGSFTIEYTIVSVMLGVA